MAQPALDVVVQQIEAIDGWLFPLDVALFLAAGAHQEVTDLHGDLLEIGAYRGKSAVVIGHLRRDTEDAIVCDVFEDGSKDPENQAEWDTWYTDLAQAQFDENWASVHERPPRVVRRPSAELLDYVDPGSVRFAHIDGCHLQREVATDIDTVLALATPNAVLVFDDIFLSRSPGVAAAVWPAVAAGRLRSALLSGQKLYATTGDPAPLRDRLVAGIAGLHDLRHDRQFIYGDEVALVEPQGERDALTGRISIDRRAANVAGRVAAKVAADTGFIRRRLAR
jgi:hypothetical protein